MKEEYVAKLPLHGSRGTLLFAETEDGYKAVLRNADGETEVFRIKEKGAQFGKETVEWTDLEVRMDYDEDDKYGATHTLLDPALTPAVIQKEDGRLWCTKCRCWVPNTANAEMRKEGCFAHSHICGIKAPGEVYEESEPEKCGLLVTLIRVRSCEDQMFTNTFLVDVSADDFAAMSKINDDAQCQKALEIIKENIKTRLASAEGWNMVCRSSCDYNWGDAVMDDIIGKDLKAAGDIPANRLLPVTITVDQDEYIAPEDVPVEWCRKTKDGREYKSQMALDMADGWLYGKPDDSYEDDFVEAYVVMPNGDKIPCDEDADYKELKKTDWTTGPSAFDKLRKFIGKKLSVEEDGSGSFRVVDENGNVILSSDANTQSMFQCDARKLEPHVGHAVVCVGYGIDEIVNVSIECEDCGEVLFDIDK